MTPTFPVTQLFLSTSIFWMVCVCIRVCVCVCLHAWVHVEMQECGNEEEPFNVVATGRSADA